jgi:hypothetical protein
VPPSPASTPPSRAATRSAALASGSWCVAVLQPTTTTTHTHARARAAHYLLTQPWAVVVRPSPDCRSFCSLRPVLCALLHSPACLRLVWWVAAEGLWVCGSHIAISTPAPSCFCVHLQNALLTATSATPTPTPSATPTPSGWPSSYTYFLPTNNFQSFVVPWGTYSLGVGLWGAGGGTLQVSQVRNWALGRRGRHAAGQSSQELGSGAQGAARCRSVKSGIGVVHGVLAASA